MSGVSQPGDAASPQDVALAYADQLRQQSATCRLLAEKQRENTAAFEGFAERGLPGSAEMAVRSERSARFLVLLASVIAEQAIAHDELMAAGGPENSRAYVEYEATTRRLRALLPTDTLTD
ncbi:hypothetical protein G3I59_00905 [Amycolatopsis rubida]|uniref:Uncharacterized protein n=1 Tax=Amycolatopsis rubida TaxID=112413 RepID=A0A1I5Y045_9PSEU|nr:MULTISPECIES: hypothetical protein [Amycolatopsis]MYW89225.1 hypothetical protein [Amycolatopsis rubida]NEC54203.1 hypothetical protein [Amycolatopsis rubida]OAP22195.1 hypothetical protein A4R44_07005 [Amycolatopsis sp. M39]SFQ37536.1 hypothetical protein SAMN05421854_111132 [Amycolatopsis rubida]